MVNYSITFTKNYFWLKIATAFLLTFSLVSDMKATTCLSPTLPETMAMPNGETILTSIYNNSKAQVNNQFIPECNIINNPQANEVAEKYNPNEDMIIISWGIGNNYKEACNNAKDNAINQAISFCGSGTKANCQIKGGNYIFKFIQSDGSTKVAIKFTIKVPMLNGENNSSGATASFVGSKFSAKEKMMEKNKEAKRRGDI